MFVAGLMIGRTPEYLGKKIEAFEIKMASIAVLVPLFTALFGTAIAVMVDAGKAGVANPGAHGFSEILYAFSSASGNNGSAFAGSVGEHAVLQHRARHRHVLRALLDHRPGARARRLAGGEEEGPGGRRHAADAQRCCSSCC